MGGGLGANESGLAGAQPWAVWHLPTPEPAAIGLAVLGIAWLLLPRGVPARYLGAVLCLPLVFPLLEHPAPGEARVEVLDVGQGTAVLIRTAHHALLYDTGPAFGDSDAGERIVLPRLFGLGLEKLDGLILTHDDLDHTGGAPSVLRDMDVDWIATSLPPDRPLFAGQHVMRCQRGQSWQWDEVRFDMLNPPAAAYQESRKDNNMGCVLKVTGPGRSLLMTADAEAPAEQEMVAAEPGSLQADVLLAGHHGSKTSSTPEFVQAVGAQAGDLHHGLPQPLRPSPLVGGEPVPRDWGRALSHRPGRGTEFLTGVWSRQTARLAPRSPSLLAGPGAGRWDNRSR